MTSANNWQRHLQGYAPMSAKMMAVLDYLVAAKAQDWPFVTLDDAHPKTVCALFQHDLIAQSPDATGTRYKITARGERTRKAYQQQAHRYDDICPACGERPKHVSRSGRKNAYCRDCDNDSKRKSYALRRPKVKVGRMCSRCGKRPVHILSGGRAISYCLHCKNVRNRRSKKRWHRQCLQRVRAGEVLLCTRPGCTRPRHVTPSCVYELCREHYREWHNDYRHKKKAGRVPGKIGRPRKNEVQP